MLNSDDLLTFDDDSPLFVTKKTKKTKKTKSKRKPRKVPTTVEVEVEKKPVKALKKKQKANVKIPINKNIPKYMIKSPTDCKHILPAFKKKLEEKWKLSESDNNMDIAELVNYLRGVSCVVKNTRPKEYEELRVLMQVAKITE